MKILIADDHPLVRATVRQALELVTGFEVVAEAADGAEALELAQRHQPEVILMDLRMPMVDGIEATAILSARHPNIRVVAHTSGGNMAAVADAIRAGAAGFVIKGETATALVEVLERVYRGEIVIPQWPLP